MEYLQELIMKPVVLFSIADLVIIAVVSFFFALLYVILDEVLHR